MIRSTTAPLFPELANVDTTRAEIHAGNAVVPPSPDPNRWFMEQIHPHEQDLRAYLRNRFPGLADIDDLVQESFARVLQARHESRDMLNARAYLFVTARNLALARFRRPRWVAAESVPEKALADPPVDAPGVEEVVSVQEEVKLLLDAIESLPSRCREIFVLRKLEGLSQKEIAARLKLSEQTVQVQIARGAAKCALFLRKRGLEDRFRS